MFYKIENFILKDLPVHIFRDKNLLLPVNFAYKFMLIKRNKRIRICKSLKMKWHDIKEFDFTFGILCHLCAQSVSLAAGPDYHRGM